MAEKPGLDDDSLATEEEMKIIETLRAEFKTELAELKASGSDFPHTTGDIFLTRVVRGMDRDIPKAIAWYRQFLQKRKEHGLDDVFRKLSTTAPVWKAAAMPQADKVLPCYNVHFDEERLKDSSGHLLWYDSFGDVNGEELLKNFDDFKEYMRAVVEGRAAAVDRLSAQQGRLVKTVRILDVEGLDPWTLNRDLFKQFRSWMMPLVQQTSIEVVHRIYIINAAWFPTKLYNLIKPVIPERMQKRVRLLNKSYMQNEELLQAIPVAVLRELVATSHFQDNNALELSMQVIKAGAGLTRHLQVQPGQTVSWAFRVGAPSECRSVNKDVDGSPSSGSSSPSTRGVLGNLLDRGLGEASDVVFSVSLWFEKETTQNEDGDGFAAEEIVLLAPHKVDAKAGLVKGQIAAPRAGELVLTWSNRMSWVRGKLMAELKITLE